MDRWKIALVAAVGAVLGGWTVVQLASQPDVVICRDVALLGAPTAGTEAAAVAGYVRQQGGRPDDWKRKSEFTWVPRDRDDAVPDLSSLSAVRRDGVWTVVAGCV